MRSMGIARGLRSGWAAGTVVGVAVLALLARDGLGAPSITIGRANKGQGDPAAVLDKLGSTGRTEDSASGPWTDGAPVDERWKSVRVLRSDESILLEPGGAAEGPPGSSSSCRSMR